MLHRNPRQRPAEEAGAPDAASSRPSTAARVVPPTGPADLLREEVSRLHAELARERSEAERRRTIVESSSDYVFVKRADGSYVDANPAYLSALGRTAADVVGRTDAEIYPPDVADEIAAQDKIAQIAGQILEGETSLPMGGRRRHLLIRRSPWRDGNGRTLGVVTVATDLTDRKEADLQREAVLANLRGLNERARGLLDEQMRLSQRGSGILEMSRRLVAECSTPAILRLGLETAERQLAEAAVFAARCTPRDGRLALEATADRSACLSAALRGVCSPASFGAELLGARCATSALLDPRYPFDAALLDAGMKAVTAIPIALDACAVPVILAAWREPRECPREDLWFLENLAVQLALALQNADLRSELCRFRSSSPRG